MDGVQRSQRTDTGQAAYRLAWWSLAAGALTASVVLFAARMAVTVGPLVSYLAILGALAGAHRLYSTWRPNRPIALVTGALAVMIGGALAAGIIANASLRLRFPLADGWMAQADRAIGFDTPAVVLWIAARPELAWLLGWAYSSIFPLAFGAALWLALRGSEQRLWEVVAGFAVSIQAAAMTAIFLPVKGNIAYAGLEHLAGTSLPEGSGIYYLGAFTRYRDNLEPVLDLHKLDGVVGFPSFHMVMVLIVAYAARATGAVGWLVAGWSGLVAVSTIPNGGHYLVDLIGGTLLWLVVVVGARMLDARAATQPATVAPLPELLPAA
jgi:hypothetical protein